MEGRRWRAGEGGGEWNDEGKGGRVGKEEKEGLKRGEGGGERVQVEVEWNYCCYSCDKYNCIPIGE